MQRLSIHHLKSENIIVRVEQVLDLIDVDSGCICYELLVSPELVTLLALNGLVDIFADEFARLAISNLSASGPGGASLCEIVGIFRLTCYVGYA